MSTEPKRTTGGCLCGALRYEAIGEPIGSGHCYCVDCRRASGSGFIPFMSFKAEAVRFTGEAREFRSKAAHGGDAVRNRCAKCMSSCVRRRDRQIRLVHTLRRLAGRPVNPPPDLRHLRRRPPGLGAHPTRLQGLRSHAGVARAGALGRGNGHLWRQADKGIGANTGRSSMAWRLSAGGRAARFCLALHDPYQAMDHAW